MAKRGRPRLTDAERAARQATRATARSAAKTIEHELWLFRDAAIEVIRRFMPREAPVGAAIEDANAWGSLCRRVIFAERTLGMAETNIAELLRDRTGGQP